MKREESKGVETHLEKSRKSSRGAQKIDLLDSIKMSGRTLVANKLRSSLTMLGIIIGNASVIAMVGIGQGAQRLASEQFESLGPNVLFIVPGSQETRNTTSAVPRNLVLEDANAIAEQVPSVKGVSPQINSRQLVTYRNKSTTTAITGVTPEFLTVRSFNVAEGLFITNQDLRRNTQVVALGSELAERLFGDANPIGQQIRIRSTSFQVIGVMKSKGAALGDNPDESAYVPLTTLANRLVGNTSPYGLELTYITVSAKDPDSTGAAKFQIENLLRLRHKINGEDDFTVRAQQELLQIVGTVTGGLTILLAAIAAISLLVGGIGVMNIMLVSVTERTQEIGLRKAIGAREQDILIQFLIEAVILSAAGGIIGTALGIGVVQVVALLSPLKAGISPVAIIMAVSVSGGIGLFFGVVPARRAAKLDPIVALRSA